jgi:alkylation response protein AidB-like acyl-CoA dehydrogenase
MGIEVPSEYGGAGMDPIAYVLAMIEIAAATPRTSTIVSVNNSLFCNGILKFGTEEQKQKYVRGDRRRARDRRRSR